MRSSEVRAGRREGVERCGGASGMHGEGPRLGEGPTRGGPDSGRLGARERTRNMYAMRVTLEVSKLLSGWLNTLAPCAESKGGRTRCGARCGPGGGRACGYVGCGASGVTCARREGLRLKAWGPGRERTENMEFMLVTLEVSKLLSGWLNELASCRVERRACDAVWAGREAAGCVGRWHER